MILQFVWRKSSTVHRCIGGSGALRHDVGSQREASSRLHDGAFDAGLIAFDGERKLVMSQRLKKFLPQSTVQQNFEAIAGHAFALPEDAPEPNAEFLRYHREKVFN